MAAKKERTTELKKVKKDLLKVINKLDLIEQNIVNLSVKIRKLQDRIGMPR